MRFTLIISWALFLLDTLYIQVSGQDPTYECVHNEENFVDNNWIVDGLAVLDWAQDEFELPQQFQGKLTGQYEDVFYFDLSKSNNNANPRILKTFSGAREPAYVYIKYYAHSLSVVPVPYEFYLIFKKVDVIHELNAASDCVWKEELIEIDPNEQIDIGVERGTAGHYLFIDTIILVEGKQYDESDMDVIKALCSQVDQPTSPNTDSTSPSSDSTSLGSDSTDLSSDPTTSSSVSTTPSSDSTLPSSDSSTSSSGTTSSSDSSTSSSGTTSSSDSSTSSSGTTSSSDSSISSSDTTSSSDSSTSSSGITSSSDSSTSSSGITSSSDSSTSSSGTTSSSDSSTSSSGTTSSFDSSTSSSGSTAPNSDSTSHSSGTTSSSDSPTSSSGSTAPSSDSSSSASGLTTPSSDSSTPATESTETLPHSTSPISVATNPGTNVSPISTSFSTPISPPSAKTGSPTTSLAPPIDEPSTGIPWYLILVYSFFPLIAIILLYLALYFYYRHRRNQKKQQKPSSPKPLKASPSNLSLKSFDMTVDNVSVNNNNNFLSVPKVTLGMRNPHGSPNVEHLYPHDLMNGSAHPHFTLSIPDDYSRRNSNVSNRSARSTYSGVQAPDLLIPRLVRN